MIRASKIRSAAKEGRVRVLAAAGMNTREIAAALTEEGVKVSHSAVAQFLREETADRREAAEHVIGTHAASTLRRNLLDRLAAIIAARSE